MNLKYSIVSVIIGFFIGVGIALIQLSRFKVIGLLYVNIFQSIPLLIQLIIIIYGLPIAFNLSIPQPILCIISLSCNSGAYIAEHIKVGILSVSSSQIFAASTLRLSTFTIYYHIIMPQAFLHVLPSLRLELANIFKETAVLSIVGEGDILRQAKRLAMRDFSFFWPYFYAFIIYYICVNMLLYTFNLIIKKIKL